MIILVNDVSLVNGLVGDKYLVGATSAITLISQSEEDRQAIENFINQHVPHIDELIEED